MSKSRKPYIADGYYLWLDKSNVAFYERTGNKSALFFAKSDAVRVLDDNIKTTLLNEAIRQKVIKQYSK